MGNVERGASVNKIALNHGHEKQPSRLSYGWKKGIGPVLYLRVGRKKICFCLCHHKKDRTIKFFGLENYLCSRDMGILFGSIFGAILYFIGYSVTLFFLPILALPMIIDGTTQLLGWRESNNFLRLVTGFMFGIFIAGVSCNV